MNSLQPNPIMDIAVSVACTLSDAGYAFVEDDKLEALADTLGSFLRSAEIPVHDEPCITHYQKAALYFAETARPNESIATTGTAGR